MNAPATATPAATVANALSTIKRHGAAHIPAVAITVTADVVRVTAPTELTAARWRDRFPDGVDAGGVMVPLVVGAAS